MAHQNFIAEDTTIKGHITTASSLTVAGAIEGDINAGGEVQILADAVVRGDVSGPNIHVAGKIEGRINASGKLVISASGHVHGDISVRALLIEDGGTLQGQCSMGSSAGQTVPRPGQTLSPSTSAGASGNGRTSPATPPLRPPER